MVSAGNGLRFGVTEDAITLSTKLVSSALLFVMLTAWLQTAGGIRRAAAWFLAFAAGEALIGVALYFLPAGHTIGILSRLGRIGYPVGGEVLRYITDTPLLRATGTSVDPNLLGGALVFAIAFGGCALDTSTKALVAARYFGPLSVVPPPYAITRCLSRERHGHRRSYYIALPRAAVALPIRRTGSHRFTANSRHAHASVIRISCTGSRGGFTVGRIRKVAPTHPRAPLDWCGIWAPAYFRHLYWCLKCLPAARRIWRAAHPRCLRPGCRRGTRRHVAMDGARVCRLKLSG